MPPTTWDPAIRDVGEVLEIMSDVSPHPTRIVVGRMNPVETVDKEFVDNDPRRAVKFTVTSKLIACELVLAIDMSGSQRFSR